MAAHFEVFESSDGWRWRLVDGNGEIVAQSEAYTRKFDAERGAENVKETAAEAPVEDA